MLVEIKSKNGFRVVDLNRGRAIRERCLNCVGWETSRVRWCEAPDCQLYPFRLGGKGRPGEKIKAIRNYCPWCCNGSKVEVGLCPVTYCPLWPYRQSKVDRSLILPEKPKKPGQVDIQKTRRFDPIQQP